MRRRSNVRPRPKKGKKSKAHIVSAWDGQAYEKIVCLDSPWQPPSNICIHSNLNETLDFLKIVRDQICLKHSFAGRQQRVWIKRRANRLPTIRTYIDFSQIEEFGAAPALVLAACYDRTRQKVGNAPPAIDFENWSPQAFQVLFEIGFFDLIGHLQDDISATYRRYQDDRTKTLGAISGTNANGLEAASEAVSELLEYLKASESVSKTFLPEINSAVSEAMINVARHAYPEGYAAESPYICLDRWWMTAKADRVEGTLTIAIYDQGATIPGTLPKREWFNEMVANIMSSLVKSFEPHEKPNLIDHEFINYSMKVGKTQTGNARRGLGLPQMRELIDLCPEGKLSIISRSGLYVYMKGTGVYKRALTTELEGTLLEWELTLPREGKTYG